MAVLGVSVFYDKDLFPKGEVIEQRSVLASGNVLKNGPEAVKAFLEAYKKGIGYYMDARDTGKNLEEVAGYIEKYANVPKETAVEWQKAGGWVFIPRDGAPSVSSLMKWQQSFKEIDTQDTIVPQDSLFAKGVRPLWENSLGPPPVWAGSCGTGQRHAQYHSSLLDDDRSGSRRQLAFHYHPVG